jgi:hypothetical protein
MICRIWQFVQSDIRKLLLLGLPVKLVEEMERPMKTPFGKVVLFSLICLGSFSVEARADDPGQAVVPDVMGTWNGEFKLIHWTGPAEQALELQILEQDGPLVKGEKRWQIKPGGTAGNVAGQRPTPPSP